MSWEWGIASPPRRAATPYAETESEGKNLTDWSFGGGRSEFVSDVKLTPPGSDDDLQDPAQRIAKRLEQLAELQPASCKLLPIKPTKEDN